MESSTLETIIAITVTALVTFVLTAMIFDVGTSAQQVSEMYKACEVQGGLKEVRRDTAFCLNGTKIVVPWKG